MRRQTPERGAALILLIGITAALAVLAATSVMVLVNQQSATARDRADKNSMDYAEAGLNSAVAAVKSKDFSTTAAFVTWSEMAANYNAAYPAGPPLTTAVYDNQAMVNPATTYDGGGPITATTPDGKVWVEVQVTYRGRTTRLRQLVAETRVVGGLPQAALFSDEDIIATTGTPDVYAVNPDGTPDTSGLPYQTEVTARGSFSSNSQLNLAAPGTSVQSLGVHVNGSVSLPGIIENGVVIGGVPLLSDYFNQAAQAALVRAAQAGRPTQANAGAPVFTSRTALLAACAYNSATRTYTAPTDLVYRSSTTLTLNASGTTYNFRSLYVDGSLTLSGTTTKTNSSALYVRDTFTISGRSGLHQFGPIYVGGLATWSGGSTTTPLSVKTTNYLDPDPQQTPSPMWTGFLKCPSGVYNHVLGPTWVVGNAGTSDIAVEFRPTSASTFYCPLLATTEKIVTAGSCNFGSVTQPMILYMACDNDNAYTNTCEWGSTGTFTGLMVVMEAQVWLTNGVGTLAVPTIRGALFCAFDVTMSGASSVCYDQTVIDNVTQAGITTKSRTAVPGTWQELSPNL